MRAFLPFVSNSNATFLACYVNFSQNYKRSNDITVMTDDVIRDRVIASTS